MSTNLKLYVLVRKDLEAIYRMVQGAHAIAQYALENKEAFAEWNNKTIVFLGVRNETELMQSSKDLDRKGIRYSYFDEPDLSNQMTAIACYAPEKIFKNYYTITL